MEIRGEEVPLGGVPNGERGHETSSSFLFLPPVLVRTYLKYIVRESNERWIEWELNGEEGNGGEGGK